MRTLQDSEEQLSHFKTLLEDRQSEMETLKASLDDKSGDVQRMNSETAVYKVRIDCLDNRLEMVFTLIEKKRVLIILSEIYGLFFDRSNTRPCLRSTTNTSRTWRASNRRLTRWRS